MHSQAEYAAHFKRQRRLARNRYVQAKLRGEPIAARDLVELAKPAPPDYVARITDDFYVWKPAA